MTLVRTRSYLKAQMRKNVIIKRKNDISENLTEWIRIVFFSEGRIRLISDRIQDIYGAAMPLIFFSLV